MRYENIMRIKAFSSEAEIQLSKLLDLLSSQKITFDLNKAYPVPDEIERIPFPSPGMFSNMLHVLYDRKFSSKVVNPKILDNGFLRITSTIENYIQSFKILNEVNFKMGEAAIENLLKYGVTNAYDWEIANWGTNGLEDLTIVSEERNYFCCAFRTQFGSISQWIIKVSKDFSLLNFNLVTDVLPDRCIVKDIYNGVLIESSYRKIWSTLNLILGILHQNKNASRVWYISNTLRNYMDTKKTHEWGTHEWSPHTLNCITGCGNDCLYCYAKEMAIRYNRCTAETWKDEVVREHDLHKKIKNYTESNK